MGRLVHAVEIDGDRSIRGQDQLMGVMGMGRSAPQLSVDQTIITP